MTLTAAPALAATRLAREVVTDRGVVLVDPRTALDGWVHSTTGHDTIAVACEDGWVVRCARCGCEHDVPWVSPLGALDAAVGHAARP